MSATIEVKPSGAVLAINILKVELVAALIYLVLIVINTSSPGVIVDVANRASFEVVTFVVLLFLRMLVIVIVLMEWQNTKYVFSETELSVHTGVFSKQGKRYNLGQVESMESFQSMVGTMFGYGTLSLKVRMNADKVLIPFVNNPDNLIDRVTALIETSDSKAERS